MPRPLLTMAVSFAAGAAVVAAVRLTPAARREPDPPRDPPPAVAPPRVHEDATYTAANADADAVEIELVGHQNRWHAAYRIAGELRPAADEAGPGGASVVRVPADSDVRLILSSRDFVYMLTLPRLRLTQAAVPGREFRLAFRTQSPGAFVLAGSHLCGPPTPALDLTVFVEPQPAFAARLQGAAR